MRNKWLVCGCALLSLAVTNTAAPAATIVVVDNGGVKGSQAEKVYATAAAYWGSVLSNDITIRLGSKFVPIGGGALGQGGPTTMYYGIADWKNGLVATRSNSTLDRSVVLPELTNGAAAFISHGAFDNGLGIDTTKRVFDNDTAGTSSNNNRYMQVSTALVRAIGGEAYYDPGNTNREDGSIFFNSNYTNLDFDMSDGLDEGKIDFLNVVVHEMGHALGFISGLEYPNALGGPSGDGSFYDWQSFSVLTPLDMFRYSQNVDDVAPGGPSLDMTIGTDSYFSVDGGKTALYNGLFSTGLDGDSPSHWKYFRDCRLGIMNPTVCDGDNARVTALDLATFDAMGYNLNLDVLADGRYSRSTREITKWFNSAVPEPTTWTMMVLGFGLLAGALRRRRKALVAA